MSGILTSECPAMTKIFNYGLPKLNYLQFLSLVSKQVHHLTVNPESMMPLNSQAQMVI